MNRKGVLTALGIFSLLALGYGQAYAQAFKGVTLKVAHFGGTFTEAQKRYVGEPFEQLTGAKVDWIPSRASDNIAKMKARAGLEPPFDVVIFDEPFATIAIEQGLVEKLDPSNLPNLKDLYPQALVPGNYGAGVIFFTSGIVYNVKKFQENGIPEPTTWKALWDPRLAGRVGTQTLDNTPPKYMVAAAAIGFGDEPTDWTRAIAEVAKIKFHSFSESVSDLMAKLTSGDVWAAPIVNGRAWSLVEKGLPLKFVLPDNGNGTRGGLERSILAIPKGTKHKAAAEAFINLVLGPAAQLAQAIDNPYGPTNKRLEKLLQTNPAIAQRIPASSADIQGALSLKWTRASLDKFPDYMDRWRKTVQK